MNRTALPVAFGVALGVGAIAADGWSQSVAPETPRVGRIGVVDLSRVLGESTLGREYAARVEALRARVRTEGQRLQTALEKKDEEIRRLQEQLVLGQAGAGAEAADEGEQRLNRWARERELQRQDSEQHMELLQRKVQRESEGLMADLRARVQPFIDAVMQDRGLEVVLDREACVAVAAAADITDEVIARADESSREARRSSPDKPAAAPPQAR